MFTFRIFKTDVERQLTSEDVLQSLEDLFISRGAPAYIQSDNSLEFAPITVRRSLQLLDLQTLFIEPSYPLENGYVE